MKTRWEPRRLGGLVVLAWVVAGVGLLTAGDWPQFRGPALSGVSEEEKLPEQWSATDNLRWKADLPGRGVSCPVVVGNRVYLTANSGMEQNRLHVLAFDAETGKKLWERQFWASGQTLCHPKTCMAGPTPAADERGVVALFATGDCVGLSPAGDLLWVRSLSSDYPRMTNHVGRAASPILHKELAIVPMESQGASYLLGLNRSTGENRWKIERPLENNWSTPVVLDRGGQECVVTQGAGAVAAYDLQTQKPLWEFEDSGLFGIPSTVLGHDLILAGGRGLVALRPGSGKTPEVAWRSAKLGSSTPTPLVHDHRVYTVKGEILACGDLATGKEIWTLRVKGPFSASPIIGDGKLYLTNEDGATSVVKLGAKPEILATNVLKDPMLATPAIARGSIYLRSDKFLYCVGRPRERS